MKFGIVFLALLAAAGAWALLERADATRAAQQGSPIAANQRLTAMTGLLVYVLLGGIAATVIDISQTLTVHYVVGLLLLPPVVLKLVSTGYRFVRYYQRDRAYRLAGAPPFLLRFVVAPTLVASTLAVFGTGLELWLFGLRFGSVWLPVHTASAVIMLVAAVAHLFAHLRQSAATTLDRAVPTRREVLSPRSLVAGSLLLGGVLAVASLLYASPFTQSVGG